MIQRKGGVRSIFLAIFAEAAARGDGVTREVDVSPSGGISFFDHARDARTAGKVVRDVVAGGARAEVEVTRTGQNQNPFGGLQNGVKGAVGNQRRPHKGGVPPRKDPFHKKGISSRDRCRCLNHVEAAWCNDKYTPRFRDAFLNGTLCSEPVGRDTETWCYTTLTCMDRNIGLGMSKKKRCKYRNANGPTCEPSHTMCECIPVEGSQQCHFDSEQKAKFHEAALKGSACIPDESTPDKHLWCYTSNACSSASHGRSCRWMYQSGEAGCALAPPERITDNYNPFVVTDVPDTPGSWANTDTGNPLVDDYGLDDPNDEDVDGAGGKGRNVKTPGANGAGGDDDYNQDCGDYCDDPEKSPRQHFKAGEDTVPESVRVQQEAELIKEHIALDPKHTDDYLKNVTDTGLDLPTIDMATIKNSAEARGMPGTMLVIIAALVLLRPGF